MEIIVQKYGGTSVAKEDARLMIAKNAINIVNQGKKAVIVVSAMGRAGDSYATDTLIHLIKKANVSPNPRELDLIMSCGETISAAILASTIEAMGQEAIAFTGFQAGIITDEAFNDADVKRVDTSRILEMLEKGKVVVVTGFQGITESGDITTLGRGGSDNTAVILGEALNAEQIEIYTDVDGIMTADPRIVPSAKVIDAISYDDVYQLAKGGAKVVDYKAVEVARRSNRVLVIKNTFTDAKGTIVCHASRADQLDSRSIITSITSKEGIVQVTIEIDSHDQKNEILLNRMEESGISIDLINFFGQRKIFTIKSAKEVALIAILNDMGIKYEMISDCAKITIVGHRIHGIPGVMKRVVFALSGKNIDILQTSDSQASISCLVKTSDMREAVTTLHDIFKLA